MPEACRPGVNWEYAVTARLARGGGDAARCAIALAAARRRVAVFFVGHRGSKFPSTALMDPMTKAFVADIHHFTQAHGLDLVHFGKERKDDLTQRYLAGFSAEEGVL